MGMKVNGTTGLTFPDTTTLGSAGQSSVQAWVNFNGTGTVAIRANFNVSSITDNGTGDYTINFTTAMVDANYISVCNSKALNTVRGGTLLSENSTSVLKSTTQLRVLSMALSSSTANASVSGESVNNVAIFR